MAAIRAFDDPVCLEYVGSRDTGAEGILVTEFEPNGTMERMLKVEFNGCAGRRWPTTKMIIVFGMAFGMEHIHERRFLHRNLKPANLFLNPDFEPVSGPSMYIGTRLHMAPEVWVDAAVGYHQAMDAYAWAVLIYCLFTPEQQAMVTDDERKVIQVTDLMKGIISFLTTEHQAMHRRFYQNLFHLSNCLHPPKLLLGFVELRKLTTKNSLRNDGKNNNVVTSDKSFVCRKPRQLTD
jgi:serine/threonine protein kinase